MEKIKQTSSSGYILSMYSWWKALEKVIKFFDKINIGKNKKFNKRVPHSHIKKIRHNKRMPMESAIEISTQENSFPKISCKVENQKHLWWISDWDRSWWYHIILTNLLSMILHRSIYFSADTALGLSMESYPCKNRNIKCGQQATSEFQNPHLQNEARCTTFLVKMSFICIRIWMQRKSFSQLTIRASWS